MKKSAEPLRRGTAILTAKPFAFVLSSKQKDSRCDNCFKRGKLLKCSACQYVHYCDRYCQKQAWPVHKSECPNLKRISPKIVPDMARLMARVIVKLQHGGADEVGYYTDTNYRKWKDLMSHYTDLKKDVKRREHFTCLCVVLLEFLGDIPMPNTAELMGIYGRICINSFDITEDYMNSIGVGIYLGPSIMDHSCNPNAIVVFDGTTIEIRTVEDLPCLDWSQVKISYIEVLQTTKARRAELQNNYYFWCKCERCEGEEPMADAMACVNKSCKYPCPPDATECEECHTEISNEYKETFDEVTEFTAHNLEKMKSMAYLDVSRVCLKKQDGVLHPLNLKHVQTLEAAFHAAINLESWKEAELYAKDLLPGYLHYYGEINPLTGILYLMMGQMQLYLEKPKLARDSLTKANEILMITRGERQPLMREVLKPLLLQAIMESQ